MQSWNLIVVVLMFVFPALCHGKSDVLIAAIPDGLARPLVFAESGDKISGILPEYTEALAREMGRKVQISVLSHYRLHSHLVSGKVDVLCYASRAWAPPTNDYVWSKTLFNKREVILGPTPMPKHLTDLIGKKIGTILNYVYPRLDPFFKDKRIEREDGPSEEANLAKLEKGRLAYVVTDELFLDYFKTKNPSIEEGHERLLLQQYPISCNVSQKGTITVKEVNSAIDHLKSSGKLSTIFKKYGSQIH